MDIKGDELLWGEFWGLDALGTGGEGRHRGLGLVPRDWEWGDVPGGVSMSSHPTVPCPTDLCKNCHHLIARHEYTFSVVDDYQVCLLSPKSPSQLCFWNSRPSLPEADSHPSWDRASKDSELHPCVQGYMECPQH